MNGLKSVKNTNRNTNSMNREKSLNIQMVSFVFNVMMSAGTLTGACFIFLFAIGVFPTSGIAIFLMPLIALFVSIMIGTSISAIASERVVKPLNQLINATKAISDGDFNARVEETNSDSEIMELLRNFNHMAEELSNIEMFRNDFINNFSHEFKTPIVSIRGFAKQLQNENLPTKKRKEYTDIIISESDRLSKMSSNVLLLTKFENQQIITNQKEYDLDEQIRNCIILLEKQWTKKNIEMNINLEEIKFYGNEEMLSHLFINLIENSIKYSNENDPVDINCQAINNYILFKITDHGNGMDKNTLKHIFDKFYQGDSSRATKGNGLGLPIVKRIVELYKGEIIVNSEVGKGTTFSIKLPR
ncbi:MAG: sensor histidine kinase [Sedimentibacter sp.]